MNKNLQKGKGRARDHTGIAGIRNQSDSYYTTQPDGLKAFAFDPSVRLNDTQASI